MIKLILCLPLIPIDITITGYGMIVSLLLWNDKYLPKIESKETMFPLTTKFFSKDGFRF